MYRYQKLNYDSYWDKWYELGEDHRMFELGDGAFFAHIYSKVEALNDKNPDKSKPFKFDDYYNIVVNEILTLTKDVEIMEHIILHFEFAEEEGRLISHDQMTLKNIQTIINFKIKQYENE